MRDDINTLVKPKKEEEEDDGKVRKETIEGRILFVDNERKR